MKNPIYKHGAEALIPLSKPDEACKTLCIEYSEHFVSVEISGRNRVIGFGDGYAFLRPSANGLHLRVEALDFATFIGIRSLLTTGFAFCKNGPRVRFEWILKKGGCSSQSISAP